MYKIILFFLGDPCPLIISRVFYFCWFWPSGEVSVVDLKRFNSLVEYGTKFSLYTIVVFECDVSYFFTLCLLSSSSTGNSAKNKQQNIIYIIQVLWWNNIDRIIIWSLTWRVVSMLVSVKSVTTEHGPNSNCIEQWRSLIPFDGIYRHNCNIILKISY